MSTAPVSSSLPAYRPALAWLTALGTAWVFVLVKLGAFTTSIGAGMVFPDWPLSNGSLNPQGWLTDLAMFAEHSHRLSAGLMSLITIGIAVAIWKMDRRLWLRRMALFAVGLVFAQALVGGLRVLLDHLHVEMVNTSVGRLFAMVHACLAQIYVCALLALSLGVSRPWLQPRDQQTASPTYVPWRSFAVICFGLLLLQLAIAAVMRHSFAGLAISTFPWSTAEGGLLPADWNFRIGIHFSHRVMAVILTVALVVLAVKVTRDRAASGGIKLAAQSLVALVFVQITLGAASVLSYRNPYYTTAHVIIGALTLAVSFGLTWWSFRGRIEQAGGNVRAAVTTTPVYAGS